MTLDEAFGILHSVFGSHRAAANYLDLSKEHYSQLRNGRVPIPRRTAELIILKARQAQASVPGQARAVSV